MKKIRLQSIILITLGIMGWLLPALAQVKRYPTDRELQQLVDKFENRDIPIARTTAQFGMGQRSERLESFSVPTTKNIEHTNLPQTHLELDDSKSLKQSSPLIANLPDGNHAFVHPRSNAGRGRGLDRSFFFRKTGDRVIGSYVSGPLGICIEGKILSDGRIVGIGLDSSDGGYTSPQRPPQAYAQGLNSLWGIEEVQVGELVVLNVRRPDINRYEVWYKFEKVLINLDGYVRRQDLVRDESRKTCQMYHPYTGERIDPDDLIEALDENDLVIFK